MSSERSHLCLRDIRDNIALVWQFIGAMNFEAFAADTKTVYATIRALEIISEASRFLSDEIKARNPGIDWIGVRDAGNIYRHRYELVTEYRIWETVTKHLSPLERVVLDELKRLS